MVIATTWSAERSQDERGDRTEQIVPAQEVVQVDTAVVAARSPQAGADNWSVMASGGGQVNLGGYKLGVTIGQTVTGNVSLGGGRLIAGFWQNFALPSCCEDRVGNANSLGTYPEEVSLGDIMMMIDAKFISVHCDRILCLTEADINQSGGVNPICDDITLGDIMIVVDFLFINPETAVLPECL
jgi:hypothetical protein